MSKWRAKALEMFPDLRSDIQATDSIGRLWIELSLRFDTCYDREPEEKRQGFVRNVLLFSVWCAGAEATGTQEAAYTGFYETLAHILSNSGREKYNLIVRDLVTTLGIEKVRSIKGPFQYALEPHKFEQFLSDCELMEQERRQKSRKR